MPKEMLDEREFELVNIVAERLGYNQRDLSRHMDVSLGMVNLILRRLVTKGYIRINQLNKKKAEYLLTPKGFAEKMRKSVTYTLKTISSIGVIREQVRILLLDLVSGGRRNFIIVGESDFALVVEVVLRELCKDGYTIKHVQQMPEEKLKETILICKEIPKSVSNINKDNTVNLIEELAKEYFSAKVKKESEN